MIVECPGCNAPHESIYSAAQHAWKSQGGDHAEYDELDGALVAIVEHNDVVDTVEDVEDVTPPDDAGDGTREQPEQNSPEQSATTDGGRRAPPQPALEVDDQEDDQDGCPKCGDDGIPTDDLFERDGVPQQTAEYLARNYDRFCPGCSTTDTAEAWSR